MRLGLTLPHYDFSLEGTRPIAVRDVVSWARRAEELGFDAAWISDHFFYSLARYGEGDDLVGALEPITALAAAAAATRRLRLGALVLGAPFRPPAVLRSSAATLAGIAGAARMSVGVGAGWYEDEFHAFGIPFGSLGDRFVALERAMEALAALRAELGEDRAPEVIVGAKGGDRALRLVARYADRWNTVWRWTPTDVAARMERLRGFVVEAGRDPAAVRVSVGLYAIVGEDHSDLERRFAAMGAWHPGALGGGDLEAWRHDALVGTVDEVVDRIGEFASIGVDEMILAPATLPFAIPDPTMVDLIAREVIPRVGR